MSSVNNRILYNRFTKGKKEEIEDDELLCPNCGEMIGDFEIEISRNITQYGSYIGEPSGDVHDYETEDEEQHDLNINQIRCGRCGGPILGDVYDILYNKVRDNL